VVVVNKSYCTHHERKVAHFCFQDFHDDINAVHPLFEAGEQWAREQGMEFLEGPMFAGSVYGSGLLVHGFDSPPPMTMMAYNYPYYEQLIETVGYNRLIDLYSARIDPHTFKMPEKVSRIAELVRKRSALRVLPLKRKRELKALSQNIGAVVNDSLGHHVEDYPLTENEISHMTTELLEVARPELIKILAAGNDLVGFLFAFPDLSRALRKNNGKITPLGIIRLLFDFRKRERLIVNGMGILPEYQGHGGNALLYDELAKTVKKSGFEETELVQISESTKLMIRDLKRLGAEFHKTYRLFSKQLE
jgi:GNAT superfamily N-acetyltransferase